MENVKEKLINELWTLKNKLLYEMTNTEFNIKVKGDTTFSIDNLFKVYKNMLHDIDTLIDNLVLWEEY